jgi:hypothetical protein
MKVVRHDDNSVDGEWMAPPCVAERGAQQIYMVNQ